MVSLRYSYFGMDILVLYANCFFCFVACNFFLQFLTTVIKSGFICSPVEEVARIS